MTTAMMQTVIFEAKNGKMVTIRPAQERDAEQITTAVQEIIEAGQYIQKEEPGTIEEEKRFIRSVEKKENMYVVAEVDGEVVGIARVLRGDLQMKHHTGMFRTWLISKAQGMGIGKRFMDYTLNWCREQKLHKLCLTVFASNPIAYELYKKAGFHEEGVMKEQANLNGEYVDEIFMAIFFD
ncbi:GNAT family N-acetyltransferase [Bacillus songklensis]|uniref:GNAT family N-acetyltransferase n=1 Tax=Bacillus songklensis TaxID=1069116 RepID=A0ABV8B4F3_9BACI